MDILSFLNIFQSPALQQIITIVIIPAISVWFTQYLRKKGIDIDTARRDAYTASASRVGGTLIAQIAAGHISLSDLFTTAFDGSLEPNMDHPSMQAAVKEVQKAAPKAVKHFNVQDNPQAIGKKILGELGSKIGPMAIAGAGGPIGMIAGALTSGLGSQ